MPIVETKKYTRPNTGVEFFNLTNNPVLESVKQAVGYTLTEVEQTATYSKRTTADGKMIVERVISDDGLLQTCTVTFSDMATYSHVDSCIGIALDFAYKTYTETDDFVPPPAPQYVQSGINQPFSCTTTYTYDSNIQTTYPLFNSFINVIEASENLVELTNNGSVIVAVHNYQNSEDFNENHWNDYFFIEGLHTGGVTRTIVYATL